MTVGDTIGAYVVREQIGRGGGGEVYRVRDTRLQRDVALKVLTPGSGGGEEGVRRVREARAAAQLNHRGIAAIYDIFEFDGRACIVMEYVAGQSLAERLRAEPTDVSNAIARGAELSDALAHAHTAGIVHCDLKPANIRFATDGALKILDFGLARRARSAHSESGGGSAARDGKGAAGADAVSGLSGSSLEALALGTPGYMSPEQLLGEPVDCRTDVYSLGVVLFEMAVGRRLFHVDGNNDMAVAVAVLSSPPPELPREVPRGLRRIIQKCLSRRPDQRYASGHELRMALERLGSPLPFFQAIEDMKRFLK